MAPAAPSWNCVGPIASTLPSLKLAVKFIGSIGACDCSGVTYSALTVFAAVFIAAATSPVGLPMGSGVSLSIAAFVPAIMVLWSICATGPRSQFTVTVSRAFLACQYVSATTATPSLTWMTSITPGIVLALLAS